ncbi:hypothetical protein GmHk_03G006717 [Glycine max]|nr:hypothetical protein GmHk_03G006717 [Glycine max]KAH1256591.1 hypothetical protein GmHk_03G006717 [Glycine max]KAH1256592.1 hypothetical protein GmHk_03G006717 [Glycine max]
MPSINEAQDFDDVHANLNNHDEVMGTPLRSPLQSDGQSEATSRKSRQSIRLRRLTLRTLDQPRPTGVVAREKIPIVHSNWKDVLESLNDLVWDDILIHKLGRNLLQPTNTLASRTRYKSKRHMVRLFPMVVTTYLTLPLDDRIMVTVFVQWVLVW